MVGNFIWAKSVTFWNYTATISQAGPGGALVAWSLIGLLVYAVSQAMGEMATAVSINLFTVNACPYRWLIDHQITDPGSLILDCIRRTFYRSFYWVCCFLELLVQHHHRLSVWIDSCCQCCCVLERGEWSHQRQLQVCKANAYMLDKQQSVPTWAMSIVFWVVLLLLNMPGIAVYGEIEYW